MKRPNRRQIAAEATRHEILAAARRLFVERGYLQTSMADLADEAGVSIPTIYASVGPKAAVVTALAATIDPGAGAPEARARAMVEEDPVALLQIAARVTRELQERYGDIIGALVQAATVEPEIAQATADGRQMHLAGSKLIAARLAELGALRSSLSQAEAAEVIAFMTDLDTYARLIGDYGWTYDRAENWVKGSLIRLLIANPAG